MRYELCFFEIWAGMAGGGAWITMYVGLELKRVDDMLAMLFGKVVGFGGSGGRRVVGDGLSRRERGLMSNGLWWKCLWRRG